MVVHCHKWKKSRTNMFRQTKNNKLRILWIFKQFEDLISFKFFVKQLHWFFFFIVKIWNQTKSKCSKSDFSCKVYKWNYLSNLYSLNSSSFFWWLISTNNPTYLFLNAKSSRVNWFHKFILSTVRKRCSIAFYITNCTAMSNDGRNDFTTKSSSFKKNF